MSDFPTLSPRPEAPRLSVVEPSREKSFPDLCLVHSRALSRLARVLTGSEDDAQDLVQDTYLHAWERFDQLRDRALAKPWLFRILRHLAMERGRSRLRRAALLDASPLDAAHAAVVAADEETALDRLVARANRATVREAVRRLPQPFGTVVEQHDLQGFKYREVAERLEIPVGTVMSRLNRGRNLLAEMLFEPAPRRAA